MCFGPVLELHGGLVTAVASAASQSCIMTLHLHTPGSCMRYVPYTPSVQTTRQASCITACSWLRQQAHRLEPRH